MIKIFLWIVANGCGILAIGCMGLCYKCQDIYYGICGLILAVCFGYFLKFLTERS